MTTKSRLELARTVTAQLRRREGRNLLAIGLYGSVSRGRIELTRTPTWSS